MREALEVIGVRQAAHIDLRKAKQGGHALCCSKYIPALFLAPLHAKAAYTGFGVKVRNAGGREGTRRVGLREGRAQVRGSALSDAHTHIQGRRCLIRLRVVYE